MFMFVMMFMHHRTLPWPCHFIQPVDIRLNVISLSYCLLLIFKANFPPIFCFLCDFKHPLMDPLMGPLMGHQCNDTPRSFRAISLLCRCVGDGVMIHAPSSLMNGPLSARYSFPFCCDKVLKELPRDYNSVIKEYYALPPISGPQCFQRCGNCSALFSAATQTNAYSYFSYAYRKNW